MDIEEKISKIEELMIAKGYKSTHARKIIIRLFVESKEHLTADQIYMLIRKQKISLPTVYRTIDILKKIDVIKEVVIHNDRYYELNMYSQKKLHIHFKCDQCGQIKEYVDSHIFKEMIAQRDYIEEMFDDEIKDIMIVMSGICSSCKKSNHIAAESQIIHVTK